MDFKLKLSLEIEYSLNTEDKDCPKQEVEQRRKVFENDIVNKIEEIANLYSGLFIVESVEVF